MADLYDVAREVMHELGMDWTDPRTGITHKAPSRPKKVTIRRIARKRKTVKMAKGKR